MVKALADIGAIRKDRAVSEISRHANYRGVYPGAWNGTEETPGVTVVILPSMTKEFVSSGNLGENGTDRFSPTETYRDTTVGIMRAIQEKVNRRFRQTVAYPGTRTSGKSRSKKG